MLTITHGDTSLFSIYMVLVTLHMTTWHGETYQTTVRKWMVNRANSFGASSPSQGKTNQNMYCIPRRIY